ncbi:N-formylglutamate deformylase [Chelativorans sp. M5D2P16]|uniref:N-formylglutamate deformylase n=1 Tax=Chelativorans sp. M5D2P16 TaxID=3095678 RepID=UPI002ACAF633|nr:N-formylglutamate deformylase [Chelativorans sp. M5D2P16]MDZ5697266.1 N-formylglutamate deformylase [Chelativorans sp. M5D2P16]
MNPVEVARGDSPVILAFPHTGTHVPEDIWERLNAEGRKLRDTDWHVDRLYAGLLPAATIVRATFHRYCIDANRDPSGRTLYPGQNTTALIPQTDFDNQPIWEDEGGIGETESVTRLSAFHGPYHAALVAEIERVKALHGVVILYDCHSIRSRCPFLFEGRLPDLNIGTDNGLTCAPEIEEAAREICSAADGYSMVVNGRFRGGWTTRFYGQPMENVHAIQMELVQSAYLASESEPFAYDAGKAERLRPHLRALLERLEQIAFSMKKDQD